jgi:hypothetical protein
MADLGYRDIDVTKGVEPIEVWSSTDLIAIELDDGDLALFRRLR